MESEREREKQQVKREAGRRDGEKENTSSEDVKSRDGTGRWDGGGDGDRQDGVSFIVPEVNCEKQILAV